MHTPEQLRALAGALMSYQQADMEGVVCTVSREACHVAAAILRAQADALASPPPAEPAAPADEQLWLWLNGDHFLAFRNLYPCYSPDGDPMTLGEPVGRAILKHSYNREGKPNEQQRTGRQSSWSGPDSDLQRRYAAGAGQAHAAGAGASLGYGQHQIAPQSGWSAGNNSAGSQPVPELAGAAGVLAAQRNLAQGVELRAAHPLAALRQQPEAAQPAEPGELPPLPEPDGVAEVDIVTYPDGSYTCRHAQAWSEALVRDYAEARCAERDAEIERLRALTHCGCGDQFTVHDPGACINCVIGMTALKGEPDAN